MPRRPSDHLPTKTTLLIAAVLLMGGCAAQSEGIGATPAAAPAAEPTPAAASTYKLTATEEKLDCPRLTGQMRVRISQMRVAMARSAGSDASRTAQSAVVPLFGGTTRGMNLASDAAQDRAKLEAFNRRLAEKKCKTLDIDAELKGKAPAAPPPQPKRS